MKFRDKCLATSLTTTLIICFLMLLAPSITSASTNTFYASDDVWMWGTTPMDGTDSTMNVEDTDDKKCYLKFTVSDVGTVSSAVLNVRCTTGGTASVGVYEGIGNNTWTETTIAWNNRPDVGTMLDSKTSFTAGTTYSFDVSSLVNGEGTYSLILKSTSGDEVIFSTDEGTVRPELVVVDGAGATATPTPTPTPTNTPGPTPTEGPSPTSGSAPYVSGNKMYHGDGSRLIIKGVNLEMGRHNDSYYQDWMETEYNNRVEIVNLMDSHGINAVRLGVGHELYDANPGNYDKLETMIELLASKGIYSMPCSHDYTSTVPDVDNLKPFFTTIIDNARQAGYEEWLIINPWNEGSDYGFSTWTANCKEMLGHLRNTCNFTGIVVFDTPAWAYAWDSSAADEVIAYDENLLGGSANVVISNHWYPWTSDTCYEKSDNCSGYPMLVGELGRWVDEPEPDTQFALDLIDHICDSDIPNGHNGIFVWIWHWSDYGSMCVDWNEQDGWGDGTELNSEWGLASLNHMTMDATQGGQ